MRKSVVVIGQNIEVDGVTMYCRGFDSVAIPKQNYPYNVEKIHKIVADKIGYTDFIVEAVDGEKV